jgi:hypothetical protein
VAHSDRGRVILGGLLAGLIINSIEFVTNYAARILATRVLVITALVSLADTVAGTLAGAWLCKEEAVTETPRSTGLLRQARGRLSTPAPFASSGNAPSA